MKISLLEKELKKPKLTKFQVNNITNELSKNPDSLKKIEKALAVYDLTLSDYYRSKIFYKKQVSTNYGIYT